MLVCAHKERQALHYLGKEHQTGCSGCTERQPGLLICVRTCVYGEIPNTMEFV